MQSQKGMWRRVDELGRVVIPKEIRIWLNVKAGDVIEFCVNQDNNVALRKYQRLDDVSDIANICTSATSGIIDATIIITSSDHIIASTNRAFLNQKLDLSTNNINFVNLPNELTTSISGKSLLKYPIISNGDQHGNVWLYTSAEHQDINATIAKLLALMLSKYIER